jgi:hypothetical protein
MDVALPSGGSVTTIVRGDGSHTLLLAHGAGTDQRHPSIVGIAEAVASRGVRVVTFDYPYTEAGRRRPDPAPKLIDCHRAVAHQVADAFGGPLVLAGRSMGGRMATMLVADGHLAAGIVLYAYPLHPPGKPDKLRTAHLGEVGVPMLFFQGSRDALSSPDLFDGHVRPLESVTVVDMEGADHSFRGRGWTGPDLFDFLGQHTVEWIDALGG